MNKPKLFAVMALVSAAAFQSVQAQESVTVAFGNFSSDAGTQAAVLLLDQNGIALSQGQADVNTDGMLIQLGYYSQANAANNFLGTWIPITGFDTALGKRTSIGDSADLAGSGNGRISFGTTFTAGSNNVQVYTFDPDGFNTDPGQYQTQAQNTITTSSPPNGQIMSIRFYNSGTITDTTLFNTMSSDTWTWVPPSNNPTTNTFDIAAAFNAGTLVFEDMTNPFETAILIPEPSTYALLMLGALGLLKLRRRRSDA